MNNLVNRSIGVVFLLFELGLLFMYGFAGTIFNSQTNLAPVASIFTTTSSLYRTQNTSWYFLFTATAIFTVLGFGFILSYFKRASWIGFGISAFVVSANMFISPGFQKFWYNIFVNGFNTDNIVFFSNDEFFQLFNGRQFIYVSFELLRIALMNSIAMLTMLVGVIGKLSFASMGFTTIAFSFLWNLALYLNILLHQGSPSQQVFDDYNVNNVYLFAACFGITFALVMRKVGSKQSQYVHDSTTALFALLGSMFLFMTFGYTGVFVDRDPYFRAVGYMNCMFALSASLLSNSAFTILFQKRLSIKSMVYGCLSGAIGIGVVGTLLDNPGACIAIGFISGLITAVYYAFLMPIINKTYIIDSNGLIGSFFIHAFLAGFVYAPITLTAISRSGKDFATFKTGNNTNTSIQQLIYFGISLGIGLIGGAIVGLFCLCYQSEQIHYYVNHLMFQYSYGLYDSARPLPQSRIQSAQQIKEADLADPADPAGAN